jgi:hypothetical protein
MKLQSSTLLMSRTNPLLIKDVKTRILMNFKLVELAQADLPSPIAASDCFQGSMS